MKQQGKKETQPGARPADRTGRTGSFGVVTCGKGRRGRQLARSWWMIALAALGILAATIAIAYVT